MTDFIFASLDQPAPCGNCCPTLRAYITDHLVGLNAQPVDDPDQLVRDLDHTFRAEGGSGINSEAMVAYLAEAR